MSGHNKWSKIKRQKAGTDAAKSKIFSKMAKLISTASRQVKGDVTSPILRAAIEKSREYNMPADNIERAVRKGSDPSSQNLEPITYECYGPLGSALIIETLTDNRNRTAQEIKFILSKHGFALATPGSVTWAFTREINPAGDEASWKPNMTVPLPEEDGKVLGALIEELDDNDDVQDIYTNAV